ncbi:hypothetical protein MAPG_05073 [Magnaporthiopsis poae ATCC 64411]|uniref:Tyrosinase copper-binding domain-containing protein n=1 Tax=Magnaporthiopsis poae (strain ATCC 64411 / 73-15) TaxID=644358 RepID=A0A0C4DYF2_MAGP6|nr:hypothetical protein MAPG_05073 [Magnaporthiopsis poae ATCC 64411]
MIVAAAIVVGCLLLAGAAAGPVEKRAPYYKNAFRNGHYKLDVVDELEDKTWPKVERWISKKNNTNGCTLENAAVRREWSDLSVSERMEYIAAVKCLMKLPPKSPRDKFPGALNRFDDFVAFHMTQAGPLHGPTNLFAAHHYFIWAYENALRTECGYKGYQPYMNYERYALDPVNSPMFNGNSSSMGGQGEYNNYRGVMMGFRAPYNLIKPGGGGGCVKSGPFADMVVSLGPASTVVNGIKRNPRADGLGSNPRCLRRDVNVNSALGARANYSYSLVMDYPRINNFYDRYLGQPYLPNDNHPWGLHNAGHYTIGGDPGGDFYASPGDPAFYFHHGALDRLWRLWQMQDPENRVQGSNSIPDPNRMSPAPGAPRLAPGTKLEDVKVDLMWLATPPVTLRELNDQFGGSNGKFCYYYV